jgi:hypothetical protein
MWSVQYDADKVPFFAETFIASNQAHVAPNNGLARVLFLPVPAQVSDTVPMASSLTNRMLSQALLSRRIEKSSCPLPACCSPRTVPV